MVTLDCWCEFPRPRNKDDEWFGAGDVIKGRLGKVAYEDIPPDEPD
jgi:hypothetical protein